MHEEDRSEVGELAVEVVEEVHVVCQNTDGEYERVGSEQADERGSKCPHTESHEQISHEEPDKGDEEQDLWEDGAGNGESKEGIKNPSYRLFVLIRIEGSKQEGDETECDERCVERLEQRESRAGKNHERATHHPTVDADEGITVVELHHEISRHTKQSQWQIKLSGYETTQIPHNERDGGGGKQCIVALCHTVLKSLFQFILNSWSLLLTHRSANREIAKARPPDLLQVFANVGTEIHVGEVYILCLGETLSESVFLILSIAAHSDDATAGSNHLSLFQSCSTMEDDGVRSAAG